MQISEIFSVNDVSFCGSFLITINYFLYVIYLTRIDKLIVLYYVICGIWQNMPNKLKTMFMPNKFKTMLRFVTLLFT